MQQDSYQGEILSFETPGVFFSDLTERRWNIINALQEHHTLSIREMARYIGRDLKRVHEDAKALIEPGLTGQNDKGALYSLIRIFMLICRSHPSLRLLNQGQQQRLLV